MGSAYIINVLREIKNSKSRFLSIIIIVAIGVAFLSGVRATSPDMELTCNKYLHDNNVEDLSILSAKGFTNEDIEKIKDIQGVDEVLPEYYFDAMAVKGKEEKPIKVHSYKIDGQKINKPVLVEGRLPMNEGECITEKCFLENEQMKIGDYVEIKTSIGKKIFKIVGIVDSPLYINNYERGNNTLGNGKTTAFFQIGEKSAGELSSNIYNELSLTVMGTKDKNVFQDEYKAIVNSVENKILHLVKGNNQQGWYVQASYSNEGVTSFKNDADRIAAIGKVFPLFFFLIAALVCLTAVTRMVDEQRREIGTLKALGYSKLAITTKYFLYAFIAAFLGSITGSLIGFKLFPTVIFNAYRMMYSLPAVIAPFNIRLALSSTIAAVLCTTLASVLACIKELLAVPSILMRAKAPKAGKRIFIERIDFLWKRMSFIEKVTARNILRYKKRFFMTIVGIAGCTALLLTAFGLKNSILSITDRQFNDIYSYNMIAFLKQPINKQGVQEFYNKIKDNKNISSTLLIQQQSVTVMDNKNNNISNVYLIVPESIDSFNEFIHLRMSGTNIKIADEGVILTEKLSKLLKKNKGDTLGLTVNGKKAEVKVSDITEQYVGHNIYMSPGYYEKIFKEAASYNGFQAIVKNTSKDKEDKLASELMKDNNINSIDFTTNISDNFKKSMAGMNSVIWILIISAALLAFVVMYNLTSINIHERAKEIATIKVLGFYHLEAAEYIFRENIILTIIGTFSGLLCGLVMHRYVLVSAEIETIMFVRTIKPISFLYSVALTILFSGVVNVGMYGRIMKIDMVECLKCGE